MALAGPGTQLSVPGCFGHAAMPSGASTGPKERVERPTATRPAAWAKGWLVNACALIRPGANAVQTPGVRRAWRSGPLVDWINRQLVANRQSRADSRGPWSADSTGTHALALYHL